MINLLGFWFLVSVATLSLSLPLAYLLFIVIRKAAYDAMPKDVANNMLDSIYREEATKVGYLCRYKYGSSEWKDCDKEKFDRVSCTREWEAEVVNKTQVILFSRLRVSEFMVSLLFLLGFIGWIALGITFLAVGGTIVSNVSAFSVFLAPLFGYVAIAAGTYVAIVMLFKSAYKVSLWLAKVNKHVDGGVE